MNNKLIRLSEENFVNGLRVFDNSNNSFITSELFIGTLPIKIVVNLNTGECLRYNDHAKTPYGMIMFIEQSLNNKAKIS